MSVRSRVLLRMWRALARSGQVQVAQEVDKKMRRRLGNVKLDSGEYERVSQVSRDHREERRLQSHDMQESSVPVRVLLGVLGTVGTAWLLVV